MEAVKRVAAKNLPRAISVKETGIVKRVSYEPIFFSSEKSRIVIAGIIKEKIMGSSEKKSLKSALPKIKNVEKKNQPVTIKNNDITI
jgi:hypothetical protein